MVDLVMTTERARKSPRRSSTSVGHKRVANPDGTTKIVKTINTSSSSFADDVLYAFKSNVKKARSENRR